MSAGGEVERLRRAWSMADRIALMRGRILRLQIALEHLAATRLLRGSDALETHAALVQFRERLRGLGAP